MRANRATEMFGVTQIAKVKSGRGVKGYCTTGVGGVGGVAEGGDRTESRCSEDFKF